MKMDLTLISLATANLDTKSESCQKHKRKKQSKRNRKTKQRHTAYIEEKHDQSNYAPKRRLCEELGSKVLDHAVPCAKYFKEQSVTLPHIRLFRHGFGKIAVAGWFYLHCPEVLWIYVQDFGRFRLHILQSDLCIYFAEVFCLNLSFTCFVRGTKNKASPNQHCSYSYSTHEASSLALPANRSLWKPAPLAPS